MPEFQKSFQIDSEEKRDKYRSYDVGVFWNDKDKLEKISAPTEVDSIILKCRDGNSRVFTDSGPKAYLISSTERMDEMDYAHQAMKFDELDPRIQKIADVFFSVLSQQDSKVLDDFFSGNKKINLNVPLDSLPPIDLVKCSFPKLTKHQMEKNFQRKQWLRNLFQFRVTNLLQEAVLKSPLFEKFKSAREKQYGAKWASNIYFNTQRYKFDGEKIILSLNCSKPFPDVSNDGIIKDGEIYTVDTSKNVGPAFYQLVNAYSKNSQICPVKIIGKGLKKAKVLFDEIKRLSELNTEDSKRQALSLQASIGFYLHDSHGKKKTKGKMQKREVDWMVENQKVEERLRIHCTMGISRKIVKDGMIFLLTPLRKTGGVKECVFFVIKDGIYYTRLAYQSKSHKRWRIDSFVGLSDHRGKGVFSYTTETVPFIELDDALENLEKESVILEEKVDRIPFLDDKSAHTYEKEVEKDLPVLYDFANFSTNHFPHNPKEADDLMNPDYIPDDFIPDFKGEPISVRNREEIIIEQFRHIFRGIELDFHIARDNEGRVWVDRLEKTFKDGDLTTYGTRKKSLEFGPLSMKPFDYQGQVAALNPDDEVYIASLELKLSGRIMPNPARPIQAIHNTGTGYADITPFFDQLKLIQRYREERKVQRIKPL